MRKVMQKRANEGVIWQRPALPLLSLSLPCAGLGGGLGSGLGGGEQVGVVARGISREGGRYDRRSAKLQLTKL